MSLLWNRRTLKRVQPPAAKFSDADLGYTGYWDDDYVHKNHVTLNYAGKGLNFVTKSKATIDFKGASAQKPDPKTSFSSKIVTQVWDSALETKIDNKGTVRLWGDLGTYDFGVPLTFTGKLKTNNTFDRLSWAAQVNGVHGDVNTYNRIHVKNSGVLCWNGKVVYQRGDVLAGIVTKLSTATWLLSKLTVFSSYRLRTNTLYAELTNKGNGLRADPTAQTVTVAAATRVGSNDYAAKIAYNLLNKNDPIEASIATVAKVNSQTTVRAKLDSKTNLALSTKFVHSKNLTLQVGTAVQLNEPNTFTTNKVVPVPLGISLNFSYA